MRTICVSLAFGLALGSMLSIGHAGQPEPKAEPKAKAFSKEPWAYPPQHSEFPELRVASHEDVQKMIANLKTNYPRPIPANGTALEKVRTAQVNEGVAYVIKFHIAIETGNYRPEEYSSFINAINATFRAEADLLGTTKAKIASAENRVRLMNVVEEFVRRRVDFGSDPMRQLHQTRFERLQAEADLLLLKERLAKEAAPKGESGRSAQADEGIPVPAVLCVPETLRVRPAFRR